MEVEEARQLLREGLRYAPIRKHVEAESSDEQEVLDFINDKGDNSLGETATNAQMPDRGNNYIEDVFETDRIVNGIHELGNDSDNDPDAPAPVIEEKKLMLLPEYLLQKGHGDLSIPALPPPKNVLAVDSVLWVGPTCCYTVLPYKGTKSDVVSNSCCLVRDMLSVGYRNGAIRLCKDAYWMNRRKNIVSAMPAERRRLVYNVELKALFKVSSTKKTITPKDKKRRWQPYTRYKNSVLNCVYDHANIPISSPEPLVRVFRRMVIEAVRKDLPGAVDLMNTVQTEVRSMGRHRITLSEDFTTSLSMNSSLAFFAFQHKYGVAMPWMTMRVWTNIANILQDDGRDKSREGKVVSHKSRLAKFRKLFRKYPNYKGFLQAAFQGDFKNICMELVPVTGNTNVVQTLLEGINSDKLPKAFHHLVVGIIRSNYSDEDKQTFLTVASNMASDLLHRTHDMFGKKFDNLADMGDSWVKTVSRILKTTDSPAAASLDWISWRDLHRMARDLKYRVRPNKFDSVEDMKALHNKLAEYQNRNLRVRMSMGEMGIKEFTPFDHPTDEFDGFRFEFLDTPLKLLDEGTNMHHCVGGYADSCACGASLIFSMRKGDRAYVTIELSGESLKIKQQYSLHDAVIRGTKANEIIQKWHKAVLEKHKDDKVSYYNLGQVDWITKQIDKYNKELEYERDADLVRITTMARDDLVKKLEAIAVKEDEEIIELTEDMLVREEVAAYA